MRISSQGLEAWRANEGGSVQLTQLSAECHADIRAYCSVIFTDQEQGESSCTDLLSGVLTSNAKSGQAQKA